MNTYQVIVAMNIVASEGLDAEDHATSAIVYGMHNPDEPDKAYVQDATSLNIVMVSPYG